MQRIPGDPSIKPVKPAAAFEFDGDAPPTQGSLPHVPAVIDSRIFAVSGGHVRAFEVHAGTSETVSLLPASGDVYRDGRALIFESPDRGQARYVAIDAASGKLMWKRRGSLMAAGQGTVVAVVAGADWTSRRLEFVRASDGRRRWEVADFGCMARPPVAFAGAHAIVGWAGSCPVSADEATLMAFRVRDGAENGLYDLTGVLMQTADAVFLGGDDRHWGSYGPGRFAIFDVRKGRVVFSRGVAPDPPSNAQAAFEITMDASSYAVGSDAVWVTVSGLVYRYSLFGAPSAPQRLVSDGLQWLHVADGRATFFCDDDHLIAVVVSKDGHAMGYPFAGAISGAEELRVLDDRLFLRDAEGNIDVFRRSTRKLVRKVSADCEFLETVVSVAGSTVAICSAQAEHDSLEGYEKEKPPRIIRF
jgi:outer membrane protein assembly factor BamB